MTLLVVHPHPDDESILTAGLMLRAHQEGRRVVLVTAPRGEEGEWHGRDGAAGGGALAEVRSRELAQACRLLGVDRQVHLGFRDSGMRAQAAAPRAFSAVPLAEAAAPIAALLREERPDLVVTATPDGTYGHPDHIRAHDATMAALEQLRSEGWQPSTVAMVAFPHGVAALLVQGLLALGLLPSTWLLREASGTELAGTVTRFLVLRDLVPRKREAILAHRSQLHGTLAVLLRVAPLCRLVLGVERYAVAGCTADERAVRSLSAYA
ncbi:MAG: PIG-L deacetylase family protein [Candidatus Dormibacteraceae bacterium]